MWCDVAAFRPLRFRREHAWMLFAREQSQPQPQPHPTTAAADGGEGSATAEAPPLDEAPVLVDLSLEYLPATTEAGEALRGRGQNGLHLAGWRTEADAQRRQSKMHAGVNWSVGSVASGGGGEGDGGGGGGLAGLEWGGAPGARYPWRDSFPPQRESVRQFAPRPRLEPLARQVSDAACAAVLHAASAAADAQGASSGGEGRGWVPGGLATMEQIRDRFNEQRCVSLKAAPRSLAQVQLAADHLGLPYGGEHGAELLFLADASLCVELPLGWEEFASPDDGKPFYLNTWSGACMWEHPQRAFLRGVVEASKVLRNPTAYDEWRSRQQQLSKPPNGPAGHKRSPPRLPLRRSLSRPASAMPTVTEDGHVARALIDE